jgi:hypothetical protein
MGPGGVKYQLYNKTEVWTWNGVVLALNVSATTELQMEKLA